MNFGPKEKRLKGGCWYQIFHDGKISCIKYLKRINLQYLKKKIKFKNIQLKIVTRPPY